jgi:hypothetical protein
VRTLYYYTSYERWPAVRERGEVPVDELSTDADQPARRRYGRAPGGRAAEPLAVE